MDIKVYLGCFFFGWEGGGPKQYFPPHVIIHNDSV